MPSQVPVHVLLRIRKLEPHKKGTLSENRVQLLKGIALRHVQPYYTPGRSCSCHLTRGSLCIPFPILASPQPACRSGRSKRALGLEAYPAKWQGRCAQRYTRTRNPPNRLQPFLLRCSFTCLYNSKIVFLLARSRNVCQGLGTKQIDCMNGIVRE